MALLFLFVFVFFGVIILLEKGNPFQFYIASQKIEDYTQKNYPTLYDDFQVSSLSYFPKQNQYGITVKDKRNEDLSFVIAYNHRKEIEDTYFFDYVEGTNFLAITENKISDKLNQRIKDKTFLRDFSFYRASIKKTLDQLEPSIQEDLIYERNLEQLPIYSIEASTSVSTMNVDEWKKQFEALIKQTNKISFEPLDYALFICKKDDGNNCIQIKGVTEKVLREENLSVIFQEMLENKERIENQYHITYQKITKENEVK